MLKGVLAGRPASFTVTFQVNGAVGSNVASSLTGPPTMTLIDRADEVTLPGPVPVQPTKTQPVPAVAVRPTEAPVAYQPDGPETVPQEELVSVSQYWRSYPRYAYVEPSTVTDAGKLVKLV